MNNGANWLKLAGIPQLGVKTDSQGRVTSGGIYQAGKALVISQHEKPEERRQYYIVQCINKNLNPERHELIIVVAINGAVSLVDRYAQNVDFKGHLAAPTAAMWDEAKQYLSITVGMDYEPQFASRFMGYGFLLDGNVRRNAATWRVTDNSPR